MRLPWFRIVAVGCVFLATGRALHGAGPGAIPIPSPVVLTAGGTYFVTNNIVAGGSPAIQVVGTGIEDFKIDLNGFSLYGASPQNVIEVVNVRSITIHNGSIQCTVSPPGNGVDVDQAGVAIVDDVTIGGCYTGIEMTATRNYFVQENIVTDCQYKGVSIDGIGAGSVTSGRIQRNEITLAAAGGILVQNNHAEITVRDNRVSAIAQGTGIEVVNGVGCLIEHNGVQDAALDGIRVDQVNGCTLRHNSTVSNSMNGMELVTTRDTRVVSNLSASNGGDGLRVDGVATHIEANMLNSNGGSGLLLDAGAASNTYCRNRAFGNVSAPGTCAPSACGGLAPPDFCDNSGGLPNTSCGDNLMPGPPAC